MGNPISVLNRLRIEINNKQYYSDDTLTMYLDENGLDSTVNYDKSKMQKQLLQTVYDVLQSLSNNIDLFRSVETEFATTGQAYNYLRKRMDDIEARILALPNSEGTKENMINFMFNS